MRNTCPVKYACGGTAAYWSESKMPTKVGMTKIYILYDSLTDDPVTGMDTIVVLTHCLFRLNPASQAHRDICTWAAQGD